MIHNLKLIAALSFILSGDMLFNIANIWCILARGGSIKSLGLFICFITIVAFLLSKTIIRFKTLFETDPKKSFSVICVIGIFCSLFFLPFLDESRYLWILYFAGTLFSILAFFIAIIIEAVMAQEVFLGHLDSNKASRILQTAIQISAFLGGSISGFLLTCGGMKTILMMNIATYSCGLLFFANISSSKKNIDNSVKLTRHENKLIISKNKTILKFAFAILFLLAIQISAFNFLIPLIAQREKDWSSIQFGLIDATGGIGAFFSTCIFVEKYKINKILLFSFVGIILGNTLFFFSETTFLATISAFILGFFVNALRIKQRELIYGAISNNEEIVEWMGYITLMTTIVKSITPLLLAFVTIKASITFMFLGFVVGIGIAFIQTMSYLTVKTNIFFQTNLLSKTTTNSSS